MCYTYDLAFEEYAPINDLLGGVSWLEQYTGLKDKNGAEIYEGDILTSGENDLGMVEWNYDSASFLINFGELQDMTGVSEWAVIIGNLHEHKELFK